MTRTGSFGERLPSTTRDEIGTLITAFNDMMVELAQRNLQSAEADMRAKIAELRGIIVQTLEECKRLSMDLRPAGLDDLGVPYEVNPRLVRGLDYYRRTTFEFVIPGMGAQNTVAAGGRYDGLVEELGGQIDLIIDAGRTLHGIESTVVGFGQHGLHVAGPGMETLTVRTPPASASPTCRTA